MQFRLLGPLEVDGGSGPLPLGGPKQRAVLAHLLVRANEVVPAETLLDEVWGEEPPETARKIIQTYVSHLRKVVGHERIQGHAPGYRLRIDPSELDAARFETLVREGRKLLPSDPATAVGSFEDALALWRGPAFGDLVGDQPSLLAQAARLDEARLEAQEGRIQALLASGADARAIGEIEILVAQHPLRESLWGHLMLALYRQGRQADALTAYQRAREVLADELGIDPSPELSRLHERVLKQDPGLDARGEPLRGYRLLEKIGEGATGVVFRAIQPQIARDVSIKIFHGHLASDPAFVRRFEREAQAVAALEHPHIVPIYDYWREPGRAYIASRYLRGGSLRARVQRGDRLEPGSVISLVEQIATALAFAHRQGIAHGDIRLSNLFMDADANAYLGDFLIGVDPSGRDPEHDIQDLIGVARELLADAMPLHLAELVERADPGTDMPTAEELLAAARRSRDPVAGERPVRGDVRNPYKGLRPFTEADAADFFGRSELVRRVISRLGEPQPGARFLAVVGPSGGGKSSVVRAGMVPAVRRGAIGGGQDWYVAEMFPGAHPIEELENALLRIAVRPMPGLREGLESGSRGLLDAVDRALPPRAQLLLVVDQFEEVFTLTTDEPERELFLEELRVAAVDPDTRVRVVVTLRADFYDRPLAYPRFGELLAQRNEAVPPLAPDELETAIRAPAEAVGIIAESGLVAEMIADVAHQPGALPLLQYALTELFERREGNRLTPAACEEIGGVAGALSARAERIYASTDGEGRRAIKQVFLRLIALGEGREDTRRRVCRSELDALDVGRGAVDAVLNAFGRHRLLTFDREPATREPTVEIAHEALLGAWTRFRRWIDDGREDLRQNRRLEQAAAEWRGSGKDPSFLMGGVRLEQVEDWADATGFAITKADRSYLKASITQRDEERAEEETRLARERALERRSIRRMRGLVAVLAAAALVAATLTFVSVDQRRRAENASRIARDAETAQLAQRLGAQALVEEDLDLSLLLARQAVAIDDSPQTRSYLLTALLRAPEVAGVMHGRTDILRSIAVSPDGRTLAVGDYPGGLLFFDARTYAQIGEPLPVRGGVESVAYSPDGGTIALGGSYDGYLRLVDAGTREQLAAVHLVGMSHERDSGVSRIAFTPDGSRLVVVLRGHGGRDRISVRDASTLAPIGPAIEPEGFGGAYVGNYWRAPGFALTPDGRSAVIASDEDELVWWDLRFGTPTRRLEIGSGRHPLALSPDGRTAAVGIDGGLQLVDIRTGAGRTVAGAHGETPGWLLFAPDGNTLVSTSLDGTVALWDVGSATLREMLAGHSGSVQQPAFAPDGETLYTVGHDGTALAWDVGGERGLEQRFRFTHDPVPDENYSGHPGTFSPDGELVALGRKGRGIGLWLWDGTHLTPDGPPLRETGGEVKDLAFTPDGRRLAAVTLEGEGTIWDVGTRSLLRGPFTIGGKGGNALSISADGTLLATIAKGGVKLWDLATAEPIGAIADDVEGRGDIAFGPTDSTLAIVYGGGAEGGTLEIWDAAERSRITTLPIEGELAPDVGYEAIAFSPDGRTIATGTLGDPIVRVLDLRSGELVRELDQGHPGQLTLDFGPGGQILAVSGFEPVAALWDVATGAQIGRTLTAGDGRAEIDLSPDGRWLLLTHADGRGAIYDVDPASWARRACRLANRTLTPEEWQEFLPAQPYEPACAT